MSPLRRKLPIILPLLLGGALLCLLTLWKSSPLVSLEHRLFFFPERFEPESIFSDHGEKAHFKVELLDFKGEKESHSLGSYLLDKETRDIISHTPENWAYLLSSISQSHEGILVIESPLSWTDASELSIQTLDRQIAQKSGIVIGLAAEFNNTGASLPPFLESSVIPADIPDFLDLPQIDFLTHPPSLKAPLFGISNIQGQIIESTAEDIKVPMLVQWGQSILPSTHLAALLRAQQLHPQDLIIDPAGYLRFGQKGSILSIDPQGRSLFPNQGNSSSSAAQILISPDETRSSKILLHPDSPKHLTLLETHLSEALSQKPKLIKTYQRWPLPLEISALIILTLLLQLRRLWLSFLSVAALFTLSVSLGHWFLLSPVILLLITFFALRKPKIKAPKKKETTPAAASTPPPHSPAVPVGASLPKLKKPRRISTSSTQSPFRDIPKREPSKKAAKKTTKKASKKSAKKATRKKAKPKKKKRR